MLPHLVYIDMWQQLQRRWLIHTLQYLVPVLCHLLQVRHAEEGEVYLAAGGSSSGGSSGGGRVHSRKLQHTPS